MIPGKVRTMFRKLFRSATDRKLAEEETRKVVEECEQEKRTLIGEARRNLELTSEILDRCEAQASHR